MSGIEDPELTEIEQRAGRAFAIAPTPWTPLLETRHVIGGESYIRLGNDPNLDQEQYVSLHIGSAATAAVVRLLADRSCRGRALSRQQSRGSCSARSRRR
jgi:hypothetical protein